MNHEQFAHAVSKKAFEISYALFRVGQTIRPRVFSEHLEEIALSLLRATTSGKYVDAQNAIVSVEYYVRLGSATGIMAQNHADILIKEGNELYSAISDYVNSAVVESVDLNSIFSPLEMGQKTPSSESGKKEPETDSQKFGNDTPKKSSLLRQEKEIDIEDTIESAGAEEKERVADFSAAQSRQSVILEKIRDIGECRLKDLQEVLPNISERTIRYDLQGLIEQGLIERIGSSGPATYYQIREDAFV